MKQLLLFILFIISTTSTAQIGYQVTLLNTATGEPRANETVNITVEITNSAGGVVCSETKSATTNDFGILSVAVGNSETFAETDWSKLPFFISATVDGVMIGKSQLLSVPVAEHAKHTGELTREFLNGKRLKPVGGPSSWSISFTKDKCTRDYNDEAPNIGAYYIIGNVIVYHYSDSDESQYRYIYYVNGKFCTEEYIWE